MKFFKLLSIISVFIIFSCSDEINNSLPFEEGLIEKRQYIEGSFQAITSCEAGNLTYFFEDCFDGTGYEDAIPAAMELYNETATSLHFTQVFSEADADLVFNCVENGSNCGVGAASSPLTDLPDDFLPNTQTSFPSGGTIGRDIELHIEWNNCSCEEAELNICFFMHAVLHEVAHALGLYHNDMGVVGGLYPDLNPIHVEGTTTDTYDPGSIINNGADEEWCDPGCAFNDNDILALQALYPVLGIVGPETICIQTSYYFCLPCDIVGSWSNQKKGKSNPFPTSMPLANCSAYGWAEAGTYTISVTVSGVIYKKEITVLDCF